MGGGPLGRQSASTPKQKPRSPSMPIRASQYTAKSAPIVLRYSVSGKVFEEVCSRMTMYHPSSGKAAATSSWKWRSV